ncbi:hypothetical protein ACFQ3P_09845 [Paraburkholderia sabiae]|jgi:hypothetical protein|uniref:KTSC domain-containing protein n=1 Tax=Paraburkholderia sabiae TaxID=273251 RepID=A0ABU9Q5H8_9BURK|nr:hypothetical protein [Paraburkholderia sabiae]WJZ74247.1 hypothetical protein QEN71_00020 [Paraburkholderia sabiae]CAD6521961.1 hypothetical protein LMG24235_01499 [Paraburkholderia sabiae]CAG9237859.1 conserved hypothetical protein [Paraburkholderia sabiae]
MKRYRNLSGSSGVVAYETADDGIVVKFLTGDMYLYDYARPGRKEVEEMKRLAVAGRGLATYISKVVKDRYARKWQHD